MTIICDGAFVLDEQVANLLSLDRSQEGILDREEINLGQHPPTSRFFRVFERSAADFAQLAESDHVVETTVSLDVENRGDSVITSSDLCDWDFLILHVLTLVDP